MTPHPDPLKAILFTLLLLPLGSVFGAPPAAVESQWPEIFVTVHQIARLPNNRVSVIFIYRASPSAPDTYIAGPPLTVPEDPITRRPSERPQEFAPYSLEAKGELVDEATGERFSSAEAKAGDGVDPGRTQVREVIRSNEGVFLGGIFNCPPVNQDIPPKPQSLSFHLPDLKKSIKGIPLPREENVPLNFLPKPRLHPPPVTP